jgi:hypothetical protein
MNPGFTVGDEVRITVAEGLLWPLEGKVMTLKQQEGDQVLLKDEDGKVYSLKSSHVTLNDPEADSAEELVEDIENITKLMAAMHGRLMVEGMSEIAAAVATGSYFAQVV